MTPPRALLAALLLLLAAPLSAQTVRLEGGDTRAVRLAREILADSAYLRISRDTILPESFHTPGDLVIVDAEVRLEGAVEGRVAVLGGELFIRPGARIGGPVAVVGGMVYPSALARVGEVVEDTVPQQVAVVLDSVTGEVEAVRVIPPPVESPVQLPGLFGLRLPTYDRVDGLTLAAGPSWRISERARLDAWVSYRTARAAPGGGAALRVAVADSVEAVLRAARETATHDAWIRGPLSKALAALFLGTDERNYWASDRLSLTLARVPNRALLEGETALAPRLTLLASRDRSLPTRAPWSLFGELDRPNPEVDEGTLVSATLGAELGWRGRFSTFRGEGWVERSLPGVSDLHFTQLGVDGTWSSLALYRHTISVYFRGMAALGGDPAPRQRWSFVGGSNTLPTYEVAEQRGDRVAYVASSYGIPLERFTLPIVGFPTFRVTHRTGAAWVSGEPVPEWLQNLGAGLHFSFVRAEVYVDPTARGLDPSLSLGLTLPGM